MILRLFQDSSTPALQTPRSSPTSSPSSPIRPPRARGTAPTQSPMDPPDITDPLVEENPHSHGGKHNHISTMKQPKVSNKNTKPKTIKNQKKLNQEIQKQKKY